MAIQIFQNNIAGAALATAVPDPKHIWYDLTRIVVYTGQDIPPSPPVDADIVAIKAYAKAVALRNMTPAQVQAWFAANVTNLASAQDALLTLAMIVSYMAKQVI